MKHDRSINVKYKKLRTRKGVERTDKSNDDVETLTESPDAIDFYVWEEPIHSRTLALKVIKKKLIHSNYLRVTKASTNLNHHRHQHPESCVNSSGLSWITAKRTDHIINKHSQTKKIARALNNICETPLSQLPQPCVKGYIIYTMIMKDEYQARWHAYKHSLHARIIWPKGEALLKIDALWAKLLPSESHWASMEWHLLVRVFMSFNFLPYKLFKVIERLDHETLALVSINSLLGDLTLTLAWNNNPNLKSIGERRYFLLLKKVLVPSMHRFYHK